MKKSKVQLSVEEADVASRVLYYFMDIYDEDIDGQWPIEMISEIAEKLATEE